MGKKSAIPHLNTRVNIRGAISRAVLARLEKSGRFGKPARLGKPGRLGKSGRLGKPGRNGAAGLVRMAELQLLTDMTAKAFGCPSIKIQRKDYGKALEEYALFTRSCMAVPGADEEKVFRAAYSLGRKVRRITGFTKPGDLERLVFYLYRNIGIEMDGDLPGEVIVRRCYFSGHYTPDECRLMSAADSGVISGIFGGGRLRFSQRITEGCECCRACFGKEKKNG